MNPGGEFGKDLEPQMSEMVKEFEDPKKGPSLFEQTVSYIKAEKEAGQTMEEITDPTSVLAEQIQKKYPKTVDRGIIAYGLFKKHLEQSSETRVRHSELFELTQNGTGPLDEYKRSSDFINEVTLVIEYLTLMSEKEGQQNIATAKKEASRTKEKYHRLEQAEEAEKKRTEGLNKAIKIFSELEIRFPQKKRTNVHLGTDN